MPGALSAISFSFCDEGLLPSSAAIAHAVGTCLIYIKFLETLDYVPQAFPTFLLPLWLDPHFKLNCQQNNNAPLLTTQSTCVFNPDAHQLA